MIAILIVGGLVLLFFGADWLVKGAVTMALHWFKSSYRRSDCCRSGDKSS